MESKFCVLYKKNRVYVCSVFVFVVVCVKTRLSESPSKGHNGVITEINNWLKNAKEDGVVGTLRDPMPPLSTIAFIYSY